MFRFKPKAATPAPDADPPEPMPLPVDPPETPETDEQLRSVMRAAAFLSYTLEVAQLDLKTRIAKMKEEAGDRIGTASKALAAHEAALERWARANFDKEEGGRITMDGHSLALNRTTGTYSPPEGQTDADVIASIRGDGDGDLADCVRVEEDLDRNAIKSLAKREGGAEKIARVGLRLVRKLKFSFKPAAPKPSEKAAAAQPEGGQG